MKELQGKGYQGWLADCWQSINCPVFHNEELGCGGAGAEHDSDMSPMPGSARLSMSISPSTAHVTAAN